MASYLIGRNSLSSAIAQKASRLLGLPLAC